MITISAILNVLNSIWPYLIAVLLFLLLILIHEFGHFIAAKILGVRVNEFAIGFGPKLLKWGKGETKYAINLVPLGGYCAMEGEDEASGDSRAFCNKKPWRRFLIVVMGAVFNLILGLILVAVTLIPEKKFATTVVAKFDDNAVSSQYGLQVGDEIVEINGRHIFTTYDLMYEFTNVEGDSIDITVKRDGKRVELDDVKFKTEKEGDFTFLTFDFWVEPQEKTVWSFISNTFSTALSYCAVVFRSLIDLIGGRYGISAMSGIVGTTAAIGNIAKQNLMNLIPVMALITINLGLFNLLPLPALDGGRLLFIVFEMIFRKPVPQKFEAIVHAVGFILLILLMMFVTFNDVRTLIVG